MIRTLFVAVLIAGCRKKVETTEAFERTDAPVLQVDTRPVVEGPVRWWDKTGLCLDVPVGWSGRGRGTDGTLLSLEQADTGVVFTIFLGLTPPDRRDMVKVLDDPGTYRDLPALGDAGVESWTSEVPGGPTLHVWHANVKGQPVRVEARYPFGRTFQGLTDVEELLSVVCLE